MAPRRDRALDRGVHLAQQQVAPERVVVAAGEALLPVDDAGHALHVHGDVDLHARRACHRPRMTPTKSLRRREPVTIVDSHMGDTATERSGIRGDTFLADEVLAAELAAEQAFVDRVYVQLEKSARNARALAREGHGRGRLGHEGGLVERDAMVFQAAQRIAQLDAAHEGLVFGRLDLRPTLDPRAALHRPDRPARRRTATPC